MKIQRSIDNLHPILADYTRTIQRNVIDAHNMPIRLFETGRNHDRHEMLLNRGKTKDIVSRHLYNLKNVPPLYATAVDYVYYDKGWSWNLRDSSVVSWYILFGNLVLDMCPGMQWRGTNRKAVNFCHFELQREVILSNMSEYPCVI